jgi:hypothetical protein
VKSGSLDLSKLVNLAARVRQGSSYSDSTRDFPRPRDRLQFGELDRSLFSWSVSRGNLGVLARECLTLHVWVPVHESAIGVILPCPDMQGVKGRQPKTVGSIEKVKKLTH